MEDDSKIAELVQLYLEKENFRVLKAEDGAEGLELALKAKPDLIVLDRMLPSMEGLEVLRAVRAVYEVPILILSAKGDEIEKVIGLEVGADDYLSKPFSPKELVARVKALLRRSKVVAPVAASLHYKDLSLDSSKMQVLKNGQTLEFSALEFKLLHIFMKQVGHVFSRDQLMQELYDSQARVYDRTIDAHIKNLRKKLGDSSKKPIYIASVFGVGYKLLDDENLS
ncbi:MAG: response regulator transcription factor [Candidatus Gracilibacteria bacterium]